MEGIAGSAARMAVRGPSGQGLQARRRGWRARTSMDDWSRETRITEAVLGGDLGRVLTRWSGERQNMVVHGVDVYTPCL
jgi:hypothetical protein